MAWAFKAFLLVATALFEAGSTTDLKTTMPSVSEICALAPGNTILVPNSCNRWFKCPTTAGGKDYEEGSCVSGLYFDKDTQRCAAMEKVACPYIVQQTTGCANQADNVYLADPEDCNGYIFCKAGQEMRAACPSNLVFNPYKSACVYKQDYICTTNSGNSYECPVCRSLANGTFFADDEDCSVYHSCSNGALKSGKCSKGTAFDYILQRCVLQADVVCHPTAVEPEPESTACETEKGEAFVGYIAANATCSSYYHCKALASKTPDRHPERLQCDNGYFFEEKTLSCRDRVNVKCLADRCEGMGNKYVNVVGNCAAYGRCKDGVTVGNGTCPTGYNFDERTQTCTAQKVSYAACSP